MTATVVIAGAGPTGMMLACELRLAGVDVAWAGGAADTTSLHKALTTWCGTV